MEENKAKEAILAETIFNALNSLSFKNEEFAKHITNEHPTLKQSFYRLIRASIKAFAEDTYVDMRNEASHGECKAIMEFLDKNGRNIPFI